jgi:hypothetical protein
MTFSKMEKNVVEWLWRVSKYAGDDSSHGWARETNPGVIHPHNYPCHFLSPIL